MLEVPVLILAALMLQSAPACAGPESGLPAAMAAWRTPVGQLAPGAAAKLRGSPPASIAGLPANPRPGNAATAQFMVTRAATYGVALDQPGWIDVVPDRPGAAPLVSVAHGRGPACTTIRKIVRFALEPGAYRLYVTGLAVPEVQAMILASD